MQSSCTRIHLYPHQILQMHIFSFFIEIKKLRIIMYGILYTDSGLVLKSECNLYDDNQGSRKENLHVLISKSEKIS